MRLCLTFYFDTLGVSQSRDWLTFYKHSRQTDMSNNEKFQMMNQLHRVCRYSNKPRISAIHTQQGRSCWRNNRNRRTQLSNPLKHQEL